MQKNNIWTELVDYARWSPSPHNIQPWKLKIISENEADLLVDPTRLLPVEDDTGCFTTATFGTFVENMSIAANHLGFKVEETYLGNSLYSKKEGFLSFLKLKLIPTTEKENLDRELIKTRRTSRLPYNNQPVEQTILNELQEVAKSFGQTFTFSSDEPLVDWVLKLNRDTLFYDMEDDAARNEVGYWLRYSKKQAEEKKDGLWSYCLNLPSIPLSIAANNRWFFSLPILSTFFRNFYLTTTKGTRTIAWFSGPFKNEAEWLKAGHMLARTWLVMTKHNVYLHPFGSIITNEKAHARLRDKFKIDEKTNPLWLIVRLGYSEEPPRSYRLSTEEIIVS